MFEQLLRDSGQWSMVSQVLRPFDVGELVSRFDGVLGAKVGYRLASRRGLERHHALADAHALPAACHSVNTGRRLRI